MSEKKRVGLSLKQKLDIIDKVERSQATKGGRGISYRELGSWAQREFGLPKAPSPATISNILKAKDAIKAESQSSLATEHGLGRKRKRVVNEALQVLEKALLEWIISNRSENGSGPKVDDSALIEKAMTIAKEANLQFDEKTFNFSRKWLLKFKEQNNICRRRRRREAPAGAPPALGDSSHDAQEEGGVQAAGTEGLSGEGDDDDDGGGDLGLLMRAAAGSSSPSGELNLGATDVLNLGPDAPEQQPSAEKTKKKMKTKPKASGGSGASGKINGLTLEQHRRALGDKVKGSINVEKWCIEARTHCEMSDVDLEVFRQLVEPHAESVVPAEYDSGTPVVVASVCGQGNAAAVFGASKVKGCTAGRGSWSADKMELVYLPQSQELRVWWTMG